MIRINNLAHSEAEAQIWMVVILCVKHSISID
jgi:hypothetical protein